MSKKVVKKVSQGKLKIEGIFEQGYGLISKSVMLDANLTIEAKAIYSFLSSFTGAGLTCYPSIAYQCSMLNISENRYHKHRKLLVEHGYITITKDRQLLEYDDGTTKSVKDNNIYTIVTDLNKIAALKEEFKKEKVTKKTTSKKVVKKNKFITKNVENSEVALTLQNEGIQNEGIQNEGTNNNSINNNSINNNSISSSSKEKEKTEEDLKIQNLENKVKNLEDSLAKKTIEETIETTKEVKSRLILELQEKIYENKAICSKYLTASGWDVEIAESGFNLALEEINIKAATGNKIDNFIAYTIKVIKNLRKEMN